MKKLFLFLAAYAILLPATIQAQPQIKENIEEIKNKINGFVSSLSEIKTNTKNVADMVKNVKDKMDILSPDLLSPELIDRLKEAIESLKSTVAPGQGELKKFLGNDLKCSPGSECFKFKKDLTDLINGIENLKKIALTENSPLNLAEKLNQVITNAPGFVFYPFNKALGDLIATANTKVSELSGNMATIMAFAKEASSTPPGIFKGAGPRYYDKESLLAYEGITAPSITDAYLEGFVINDTYTQPSPAYPSPPNTIDTNIATIELSKLCSQDRKGLGIAINSGKATLKFLNIFFKLMQDAPEVKVEGGLAAGAEGTVGTTLHPGKKIGTMGEGISDFLDQLLDFAKDNLDKCDDLRAQKMITDNQKIIMENQKLIFEALANLHAEH